MCYTVSLWNTVKSSKTLYLKKLINVNACFVLCTDLQFVSLECFL